MLPISTLFSKPTANYSDFFLQKSHDVVSLKTFESSRKLLKQRKQPLTEREREEGIQIFSNAVDPLSGEAIKSLKGGGGLLSKS